MTSVARKLGVGTPETVRTSVRQREVVAGARPGVTSQEDAELRRANEILKAAAGRFAAKHDRPQRIS